ncbi:TPA: hypothetical protein ACXHW4_001612 [Enterobacter hormaechei]
MTIDRILSLIAIIVSFIAVPASGYLSYRYAIKGERRKEFNAIADEIRRKLREHCRHFEQGMFPSGKYIEVAPHDFDSLVDVSDSGHKEKVRILVDRYQEALSECVEFENGIIKYNDLSKASSVLNEIMPYLERK